MYVHHRLIHSFEKYMPCLKNIRKKTFSSTDGNITISDGVTFDPNFLTLTCISTGGPATTVTWTRDSTTVAEGNETVLNDPENAQYTHTLTVTTWGTYSCSVSNNKPSSDSAMFKLGYSYPFLVGLSNTQLKIFFQSLRLSLMWQQSRLVPLVSE